MIAGKKAFTLVEVLLAATILTAGILCITPSFFKSAALGGALSNRFSADLLANNLFIDVQHALTSQKATEALPVKGISALNGISYAYDISMEPKDDAKRLYDVHASVGWTDAQGEHSLRYETVVVRTAQNA